MESEEQQGRMPARWYRLEGADPVGPMGLEEIRSLVLDGSLGPDHYVWSDGMPDWMHARDVPALTPPPSMAPPAWA